MTRLTLDAETGKRLRQGDTTLELVDEKGSVIGRFVRLPDKGREPTISEEEIQRRLAKGGGRPLKDILADLEKRA